MHITILAHGSRGDIQPYVALATGLSRAGHGVRLACPRRFENMVRRHGIEFAPLAGDPTELAKKLSDEVGTNYLKAIRALLAYTLPLAPAVLKDTYRACQDTDGIVHSFIMTNAGHEVAVALNIPEISALIFAVFSPTADFPNPMFPDLKLGSIYNKLTHYLFDFLFWMGSRLGYAWIRRQEQGLPELSGWPFSRRTKPPVPIIYGISPELLPQPKDWPSNRLVKGYWFLDSSPGWSPSPDLLSFFEAGPPPVFIGFGSTVTVEAERLTGIALEALEMTGQRGLLLTGWGSMAKRPLSRDVMVIDEAPFDRLFPRMISLVHHGGMGTTAAGLRAGLPAVTIPFTADQPFWGRRLHQLGLGPPPIPYKRLNAERLARAIRTTIENRDMRRRTAELGAKLKAEDGLQSTVQFIEQSFLTWESRRNR